MGNDSNPFYIRQEQESFLGHRPSKRIRCSFRLSYVWIAVLVIVVVVSTLKLDSIEITITTKNTAQVETKAPIADSIYQGLYEDTTEGSVKEDTEPDDSESYLYFTSPGYAQENGTVASGPSLQVETNTSDTSEASSSSVDDMDEPSSNEVPSSSSVDDSMDEMETIEPSKEIPSELPFVPTSLPGFAKDPRELSNTYLPRARPMDEATRKALEEQWGAWNLVDARAKSRPSNNFYAKFPNRDVPREKFPSNAWQTDKDYLGKFLPQAKALTERAMEAILAEYGHGKFHEPDKSFEQRSHMFSLQLIDFDRNEEIPKSVDVGGWTTQRSLKGLERRVLHAVMTEDAFRLVMAGHSSAAGHGNHFTQSYTMQWQRTLEPVLARLGVQCVAHNIGMGGLGTIQNALAAGSLFGKEMDILMWDSGMTEKGMDHLDIFARQGLISGNKVPVLWGGDRMILQMLHQHADADVGVLGEYGAGYSGIPKTVNATQVETLPWASRYIDCEKDFNQECRDNAYMGTCWLDRPDGYEPTRRQDKVPGGRAKWHPGNRFHQLKGRILAFPVLQALDRALTLWMEAEDYILPDEAWHVTDYYDNIRSKVVSLDPTLGACYDAPLPDRICQYPLQGRSEFTPRANPAETSIRSIVRDELIPDPKPNVYDPPDVHNPNLDVPDDAVDYLRIVENGNDFVPLQARIEKVANVQRSRDRHRRRSLSTKNPEIVSGRGWDLDTQSAPDNCDGTYDSFCGRDQNNKCLLYGHNDYRGGLLFDGYSGWLIMTLTNVQHGMIIIKVEDWHETGENKRTDGWICENNVCDRRRALAKTRDNNTSALENHRRRQLKSNAPPICDDFSFDFAIDGKITSWDKTEWEAHQESVQRVVQVWTLLDDQEWDEPRDVELAIRQRGCGRSRTFKLTHVYWA